MGNLSPGGTGRQSRPGALAAQHLLAGAKAPERADLFPGEEVENPGLSAVLLSVGPARAGFY
jgi:hypothetical protein